MAQSSIEQINNLLNQSSISNTKEALKGHDTFMGTRKTNNLNEDYFEYIPIEQLSHSLTEEKARKIVCNTYEQIAEGCKTHTDGSTLSLAAYHEKTLTVGSVGDSSVFLVIHDESTNSFDCELINHHHLQSNANEVKRLFLLGGHEISARKRLNDNLQVFRSIGDSKPTKEDSRLKLPDIYQRKIEIPAHSKAYLVLTSDGFTDAAVKMSHKDFLLDCLKKQFNKNKSLNEIAKLLREQSNEIISKTLKKQTDDTTIAIIELSDISYAAVMADGHAPSPIKGSTAVATNHTINHIKEHLALNFKKNLSTSNLNENNNSVEKSEKNENSTVNYLINDIEWKIKQNPSSLIDGLPKKTTAYPIVDSWLNKFSAKELENVIISIFLLTLKDITSSEDVLINNAIKNLITSSAEKNDINQTILADIYYQLYSTKNLDQTSTANMLLTSLQKCSSNKNMTSCTMFLNYILFSNNVDSFNILINTLRNILKNHDLTVDLELNSIYQLINKPEMNINDKIMAIHEIFKFSQSSLSFPQEIGSTSSQNSFKESAFFDKKNIFKGVKIALHGSLKNLFKQTFDEVMSKLEADLQSFKAIGVTVDDKTNEIPVDNSLLI